MNGIRTHTAQVETDETCPCDELTLVHAEPSDETHLTAVERCERCETRYRATYKRTNLTEL